MTTCRIGTWGGVVNGASVAPQVDGPKTLVIPLLGRGAGGKTQTSERYFDSADIISTVAHELRTPLCALATSSEILTAELDTLPPHELRGIVSSIHIRTLWLQRLLENLLSAAAIRDGRLRIVTRPTRLLDLARETQPVIEPVLAKRGQRLKILSHAGLPEVMADGQRISQVFVNLIGNASKFGPPNSVIVLSLTQRSGAVRATVADRGPGVPAKGVDTLFERFQQGTASRGISTEGFGLGLAIVKAIVTAHDGRVGAERRRGGGSRFWFELPMTTSASLRHSEDSFWKEGHEGLTC